jgi:TonB family protein
LAQLEGADLTNVVPFAAPSRENPAIQSLRLTPADRPAPSIARPASRAWLRCVLLCSFAAHAGIYWLLNRAPPPLASIGIEAMSVEIVLGDNKPAGPAQAPGKADEEQPETSPARIEEAARPEPQSQAQPESQPETAEEARPEPPPASVASTAAPETEQAPVVTEAPPVLAAPTSPDTAARSKPSSRTQRQPKPATEPLRQPNRAAHPAREHQAMLPPASRAPSRAANGTGPGRSDAATNYRGLVYAHLVRYQRYPAEARSRGEQGVPAVSFTLDNSGGVTSVALVRPSGIASLDQEAQAMVRRASPFPPPPPGAPRSFTAPVRFHLQ